jgi:hypothetical protein
MHWGCVWPSSECRSVTGKRCDVPMALRLRMSWMWVDSPPLHPSPAVHGYCDCVSWIQGTARRKIPEQFFSYRRRLASSSHARLSRCQWPVASTWDAEGRSLITSHRKFASNVCFTLYAFSFNSSVILEKQNNIIFLKNLRVNGRIFLKQMLNKTGWCELDSSGSGQSPVAGSCDHADKPASFIKDRKFFDSMPE